jgi:hypothetical protein
MVVARLARSRGAAPRCTAVRRRAAQSAKGVRCCGALPLGTSSGGRGGGDGPRRRWPRSGGGGGAWQW